MFFIACSAVRLRLFTAGWQFLVVVVVAVCLVTSVLASGEPRPYPHLQSFESQLSPSPHGIFGAVVNGDVFNWRPDNTQGLQASLEKARSAAARHLVIGDSTSSAYVGTNPGPATQYLAMWPYVLRQALSAGGVPVAGTGWVPPLASKGYPMDPRWSRTGTWVETEDGFLTSTVAGSTATFTSDLPGTTVELAFRGQAGSRFSVSVDGGAPVIVTASGDPAAQVYTAPGLATARHKTTVTVISDGARAAREVVIYAASCHTTTGLQIDNLARIGASALQWSGAAFDSRGWLSHQLGLNPDVVHIALGDNDLAGSPPQIPEATVENVRLIRQQWPNAQVILYAQYQPDPSNKAAPSQATWADYVARLEALAKAIDCPLVNLYKRSGGFAKANAAGLMGDWIHPNAVAQQDWGLLVANMMMGGQ